MSDSDKLEKGQRMLRRLHGGEVKSEIYSTLEEVFPDFWKMTQEHLFGDIWQRPRLSLRDRTIATLAALMATVCVDDMKEYMRYAVNVGITREEILELIMHVMNYSGWPTGTNAMLALTEVFPSKE